MKKKIRIWAIKQGLIKPNSLKESQDIFKFPAAVKPLPKFNLFSYTLEKRM